MVEDLEPDCGPLGGICAAFAASPAHWAVFLPVDLPLLPPSLVAYLLDDARTTGATVALASLGGFAQTFPAVIDRAALPVLEGELKAGRGGCYSAFQAAADRVGKPLSVSAAEALFEAGRVAHPAGLPPANWFLNVNTAEDLDRAEYLLGGPHRVI